MYTATGQRGLDIIRSGKLRALREQLGLSPNHMAMLLYVGAPTYKAWEEVDPGDPAKMWNSHAVKVAKFYDAATRQMKLMAERGVDLSTLMPLHVAATFLGMPQDVLFRACRTGAVAYWDLGVLGSWLERGELKHINFGQPVGPCD